MRDKWPQRTKLKMRITVSTVALSSALVIIFGNYSDDYRQWAFGCIGLVLGYWLR